MSAAFESVVTGGFSLVSSATFSVLVPALTNSFMLASFILYSDTADPSVASITYNGTGLTYIRKRKQLSAPDTAVMYGLVAPDAGTHDLIITFGQSDIYCTLAVLLYSGVHQTVPTGTPNDYASALSVVSLDIDSDVGDVVVDCVHGDTVLSCNQTQRWSNNDNSELGFGSDKAGEAGTTNMGWTLASGGLTSVGVALKPAISGATAARVFIS